MDSHYVFAFGEKLPWEMNVGMMIVGEAPGGAATGSGETSLRKAVVNGFTTSIINLWTKAFGEEYIQSRKVIQEKVRRLLQSYQNEVTKAATSKKRKADDVGKSKRQLFACWREKHNKLFCLLKKSVDYTTFAYDERIFYGNQQLPARIGYISEKVDENYETSVAVVCTNAQVEEETEEMEIVEANDVSINRSGLIRQESEEDEDESLEFPRPEIRHSRNLTERIKITCARVAVGGQCSAMYARKVVKIGFHEFYGHDYYLTADEQMENEPLLPDVGNSQSGLPHTSEEWQNFKYVLPSEKTINRYISLMAAQEEAEAGIALLSMPEYVTCTLHYDATTRSFVDGDWTSIVLAFSDDREFDLRPIFMAGEDRENIINLLQETYNRMALAASIQLKREVTAKDLWEKMTFLATDAVSKNHKVGEGLAKRLTSSHFPIHVLCKSHTVEGLDRSSLKVLSSCLEVPLNLRSEMEVINPNLRSFFRNSTVVQAGMAALLKIVTPDTCANSCSLSVPFERLCIEHGLAKKLVLYKERRFCKLGSCANSIIQALPILEQLLEEVPADNQLAQACRIYLKCEVFISELRLLAYFNYHVVFPFLHAVEKLSTPELKKVLPKLHVDLRNGKTDTLKDYVVKSKMGNVDNLSGDLEMKMLAHLTVAAADCIQLQCGREYGFAANPDEELRAADLSKIPDEKLVNAPTNNLINERRLSVFSKRSETAKFKTSRHTGELLRDNMVLHQAEAKSLNKMAGKIQKKLAEMNAKWFASQKILQLQKIKEKIAKKQKNIDYVLKLMQTCKTWSGPCCSVDELNDILSKNPDNEKKI